MSRVTTTSFIVLVLFFGSVFQSLNAVNGQSQDTSYVIKMSVTYSNPSDGAHTWNFTEREDDRTIGLFMNTTWQTVQFINSSFTIETKKNDTDGNPVALLQLPETQLELEPGENLTFTSTYHVVSKPRILPSLTKESSGVLQNIPEELKEKYTGKEGPWLTNNLTLQSLARSIAGEIGNETKVLTIVERLVSWIHYNIGYEVHEVPFYPNQTYHSVDPRKNKGDCDDQAILLITLCRILGIPAHLQIGAIHLPNRPSDLSTHWEGHVKELSKKIGWHGWAMVYIPPWGWLPVDLTFVWSGGADPLKAITSAAVTSQSVIQYMNITKSDYVASSRQTRDFIIGNNFFVDLEDEITEETAPQDSLGDGSGEWLLIGLIAVAVVLVTSVLLATRRLEKRREGEVPKPPTMTSRAHKP